jgi:hypothetical protein
MATYDFHPFAEAWPLIAGPDFDALKRDIAANGQRVAIVPYEGKVLDGRNRYLVCKAAGIAPLVAESGCKNNIRPDGLAQ